MTDPIGGATSKIASEMAKEVQQAMQQAEQLTKTQEVGGSPSFQDRLQTQQVSQVQDTSRIEQVDGARGTATDRLRDAITTNRTGTPQVPAAGQSNDIRPAGGAMQRVFEDVMAGQNKLDKIMNLALSGRNFSQQELLALQAGVYRFTQELELTSKVIEKGTSSVKQVLNTQV